MMSAKQGWGEHLESWGTVHVGAASDEPALIKTDPCCQLHTQRMRR